MSFQAGLLLPAALAPVQVSGLAAQVPDSLQPILSELPLRRVVDSQCVVSRFARAPAPSPEEARDVTGFLIGDESAGPSQKTYTWIVWLPQVTASSGGSASTAADSVAARVLESGGRRFAEGDRIYEADALRLLVILPAAAYPAAAGGAAEPGPAAPFSAYAVRAGAAVRKEASQLAQGFPAFLSEILSGLVAREVVPGCPPPFAAYEVGLLVTQLGTRDATVAARVEIDTAPPLDPARSASLLQAFRAHRIEVEARWLGYTALGRIFEAIEAALAGPACGAAGSPDDCLRAARAAAVETVAGLQLTAEHQITAVRTGTQEALAAVEFLLAVRHAELARTFRAVDRPVIGFSVGGILAEGSGEKLKFEVEGGRVVANGVEGEGFKALALVDLYFRRVDLSESSPGILPHASIGFTIGEVFRPGAFLATTLPFTAGRLSVFGGGILRKETTTDLSPGTEVEPGTEPIEERYRFPLVAGLKVGLPVGP